jgi:succinylglutamate desuccinylase
LKHKNLETVTPVQANPKAVEQCRRYIDVDLNRSFLDENYENAEEEKPYEVNRASEIHLEFGRGKIDFAVDLHNTTSNVGVMLVICR